MDGGVSSLPRRSRGAAGGGRRPAEPERSAGAEETARDGKNWIETEQEGQSRSGDRGGSGVQGAGGTAGRSGRAEDGPVRPPTGGGMRRPPCPGCCGPDGRGVPSLGSGVWGDRGGAGTVPEIRGRNAPPLWGDRGGGGHPTAPGRHGTGPAGSGVPPGAQSRPGGAGLPSARIG